MVLIIPRGGCLQAGFSLLILAGLDQVIDDSFDLNKQIQAKENICFLDELQNLCSDQLEDCEVRLFKMICRNQVINTIEAD
ncbi:hypothetical protein Dfri01_22030 [Dyadobacter frigoris]|nr:hypothetical protein Dfri01_22030 [Dyadobacter frigoris]